MPPKQGGLSVRFFPFSEAALICSGIHRHAGALLYLRGPQGGIDTHYLMGTALGDAAQFFRLKQESTICLVIVALDD